MGSLVKPFIYLTALESGRYNATTVVQDAPVDVKLTGGKHWTPENFTHEVYGPVPVVRALAESLNLATVGVGLDLGLPKVADTLRRFGLATPPEQVPAMLLGAVNVTPLEVMERGTGRPAHSILPAQLIVGGKSGTSSEYRDSWFAGFSGSNLAVVWVGYDDNAPTGFTGSVGALPVWAHIMADLGGSSWSAPMPDGLVDMEIEYPTGLRALPGCADDRVTVALPATAQIPGKPGCGFPDEGTPATAPVTTLIDRTERWLHTLVH